MVEGTEERANAKMSRYIVPGVFTDWLGGQVLEERERRGDVWETAW